MTPKEWNALTSEAKSEAWKRLTEKEQNLIRAMDGPAAHESSAPGRNQHLLSAKDYLSVVRDGTCYSTLRSCIGLAFGLSIVAWFGWVAFLIFGGDDHSLGIIYFIVSPLYIILVVAAKQSALLLVDLVDSMLDANRKV